MKAGSRGVTPSTLDALAFFKLLPLSIANHSSDTHGMENLTGPVAAIRSFARWVTTPPQAYAAYFVALVLVAGLSFYVGTLQPKKPLGLGPPPVSVPRS